MTSVIGNAFSVKLELKEKAKISRLDAFYLATTWQNKMLGTHGNDPEYIVSALGELLDEFLNDYYKSNPKKKQEASGSQDPPASRDLKDAVR